MKSLLFYVSVILLISMLVILIKENEVKFEKRILTVAQYYSYLSMDEGTMEIPFYLNEENHPLSNQESYMSVYFSNADETKKIQMHLKDIHDGHVETYLSGTYHQYLLVLELPYLNYDFFIQDLYMHVELTNNDQYEFYLGSFSLSYIENSEEVLHWSGLNGNKAENEFLSRLYEIYIDYDSMSSEISQIEIGVDYDVSFSIHEGRITLTIPKDSYLLNEVPIIIYYVNNQIQVIHPFRYLVDYQILKESGPLITAYAAH